MTPDGVRQADARARNGPLALRNAHTRQAQEAFLAAFTKLAIVTPAAQAAGVHRSTVYAWLDEDEEFRARYDEALESAIDLVEQEAFRRACVL